MKVDKGCEGHALVESLVDSLSVKGAASARDVLARAGFSNIKREGKLTPYWWNGEKLLSVRFFNVRSTTDKILDGERFTHILQPLTNRDLHELCLVEKWVGDFEYWLSDVECGGAA